MCWDWGAAYVEVYQVRDRLKVEEFLSGLETPGGQD